MHKDRKVQQHHTEDRRNEDFDQLTLWSGRQLPHDESVTNTQFQEKKITFQCFLFHKKVNRQSLRYRQRW
jgi:hypothetical protein